MLPLSPRHDCTERFQILLKVPNMSDANSESNHDNPIGSAEVRQLLLDELDDVHCFALKHQ